VAKRNPSLTPLDKELHPLSALVSEDLTIPSLREKPARVHGYAFRFFLVLPILSSEGLPVFTNDHMATLLFEFSKRFGGCSAFNSRSGAPFFGEYQPEGSTPVRDYHTGITVYANPIEGSDRFFAELKVILRRAPLIPQDEILIERSEVYLV
jgi:hypothetical protein